MRHLPALAALLAFACLPTAQPAEMQPLGLDCSRRTGTPDHTPHYLAGARQAGQVAWDGRIDLRVVLQLRDLAGLNATLRRASTPGHPAYGTALTPAEFADRHLPTAEQAHTAIAALRRHGLTVADAPVGALLHASGTAAQVAAAFATPLVASAGGGRMPEGEPTMPDEVIRAVQGLATHLPPRQRSTPMPDGTEPALTPDRIRRAYNIPDGLRGRGQTLAVVSLDGYLDSDLSTYAADANQRLVPVRRVLVGGYDGSIKQPSGQVETTMDLQMMSAVVPEADEILAVLADRDSPHGMLDALNWLANPPPGQPLVRHVSLSWGAPEVGLSQAAVATMATPLKTLAAMGVTVAVASGDEGAFGAATTARVVDSPAASPWVLAVGGTSLRLGPPRLETTWAGSGGGYSCYWPAPHWQHMAWGRPEGETMRAVPDVAMAADPATGYRAWVNGLPHTVGGTSAAAPIVAGIAALADEARATQGKGPLGFLPPLMYEASGKLPDNGFFDIVIGDNHGDRPVGSGDSAKPYFDSATGLGSINVSQLISRLLNDQN